jgi:hypothetical protein
MRRAIGWSFWRMFGLVVVAVLLTAATASGAPKWRVLKVPHSGQYTDLRAVSCLTATGCVAVGQLALSGAATWNGLTWAPTDLEPPQTAFSFVSCASATLCMSPMSVAPGPGWTPFVWNGKSWSSAPLPTPLPAAGSGEPTGVSCPTVRDCVVVGNDGSGFFSATWNGSEWSFGSLPAPAGDTFGAASVAPGPISCSSTASCTAVSPGPLDGRHLPSSAIADHWDGHTWTLQSLPLPAGTQAVVLWDISCPVADDCTAVGSWSQNGGGLPAEPYAAQWNGRDWSIQSVPTPGGPPGASAWLEAVSCVADGSCVAVGGGTSPALAERWNGTTWSYELTSPGASGYLEGISCVSASVCVAVGGTDGFSTPLAETTAPLASGHAVLGHTPASCAAHPFAPLVTGTKIASVRWSLNGRPLRGRTLRPGQRYSTRVNLTAGRHTLIATVAFEMSAFTPDARFRRVVTRCKAP